MSQGEDHALDEQTRLENNMYEVPSSVINYIDSNNNVMVSNTATRTERNGGGYIIDGADGNELFVPENRVLPYPMEGAELSHHILNTNNSRIMPLRDLVGGAGSKKSKKKKRKHKSKKKRSKKQRSKKKRSRKKSKKR